MRHGDVQADMRAHLAAVVDAYSDELAALNRQVIALQEAKGPGNAAASTAALARGISIAPSSSDDDAADLSLTGGLCAKHTLQDAGQGSLEVQRTALDIPTCMGTMFVRGE